MFCFLISSHQFETYWEIFNDRLDFEGDREPFFQPTEMQLICALLFFNHIVVTCHMAHATVLPLLPPPSVPLASWLD